MDGVWSLDGKGGREKRLNQNRICRRAVFGVWNERAVEEQGVRIWQVRRMDQIVSVMLAGVCSEKVGPGHRGQLWL